MRDDLTGPSVNALARYVVRKHTKQSSVVKLTLRFGSKGYKREVRAGTQRTHGRLTGKSFGFVAGMWDPHQVHISLV